ncbi:MAG: methionine--tRNA ligase [Parcubacteria group bacterium]|nr:methionine--tRNA ligase [Parcubacteria group bacterium]
MPKYFITTAIPYVNAPPHIGHALEFLQADVVARFERLREKEVFFLTGTDDNGLKNYQTAVKVGKDPQLFVDEQSALFQKLLSTLGISNDDFIRTTDKKRHWPTAQKLWRQLNEAGDLYKKSYEGLYCVGHEYFHPETDLVNGECPDYPGRQLERIKEENYFFKLSKYGAALRDIISRDELKVVPEAKKNEILAFIERGLEDVSFSRPKDKLPWGIPVPDDPDHVMYVWCEALTNYLSGIDYADAGLKFQKFWPPDLQVIGKDILRFHAAIWPAMLLSAQLPLPKILLVHGFITSGGQKMSKSIGNVVDPFDFLSRYGTDPVRYFLLREIPTTEDGDFMEEKVRFRYNGDLANGLGNLLSRVLTVGEKYGREVLLNTDDLKEEMQRAWEKYGRGIEEYKFHEALAATWELVSRGDGYVNEKEPWKLLQGHDHDFSESHGDELAQVLSSLVLVLANIGWMLKPFLPETADKIIDALGLDHGREEPWEGRSINLKKPRESLFPRHD